MPEAAEPLLSVRDLRTWFLTDAGPVRAVDGVSFDLARGETLGIVGESGSGKSVCAKSIIRLLDEPARIVGGSITFRDRDLATLDAAALRQVRGREIAMVFQDPMTSLNPVLRIAKQLTEAMTAHGRFKRAAARVRAIQLLRRMGVPAPERAVKAWPHQFSGGMRQRVMLAMGFSNEPALIIADEPTTALDVTIQAQILDLLRELNADLGTAVILISHDLGVIANVCSRILVMYAGEVVEEGAPEELLSDPRHPYTWALLHAAPRIDAEARDRRLTTIEGQPPDPRNWPTGCRFRARCPFAVAQCAEHPALLPVGEARLSRCWVTQQGGALHTPPRPHAAAAVAAPPTDTRPLLEVTGLTKHFELPRDGLFERPRILRAVDGVDLTVMRGETVGLVGESGCGKSTLARLVTRLHEPTGGRLVFDGIDITHATQSEIRPLRRRMQMIFQDPYASLNPRMSVGEILTGPLKLHGLTEGDSRARVAELLALVNLPPLSITRFPHEFSGGQRQRISIARALSVRPDLIVADEPISALDVNIQAQIINLMVDLQERLGLTYLFIAHDLAVVRHVCDRIVVLYLGKVMEVARASDLFLRPLHPYTRSLVAAAPVPDPRVERTRRHVQLRGEPASPISPPSGCRFRTRCPIAAPICSQQEPPLVDHGGAQFVACHFPGMTATLPGVTVV
jgi:peptide/nickel transport system ATP-binding protein